jgi:hypothetical protein
MTGIVQCTLYIKCTQRRKCFEELVEGSQDKYSEVRQMLNISVKRKASSWLIYLNCMMMHGLANFQLPRLQETLKKLVKRTMPYVCQQILQNCCCSSKLRKNMFFVKMYDTLATLL